MQPDTITLGRAEAQAILEYLVQRPFGEVHLACGWLSAALNAPTRTPQEEAPEEGEA